MARTFGGDQVAENTRRIVGTYGYMAPEYALYGLFSVKSDVFSFGILLLEIVWQLWIEGRPLELVDSSLDYRLIQPEVKRSIHIGLLCVQQNPEDRPNMSTVVLMLNGESSLPQPKQPGLLIDVVPSETCSSSSKNESCSVTDFTITTLEAR
ncbi:UNVERIFIED_CONTAM: Receptor-like serine/threonine-protein kinase SD1-8 [Sesamum angustifolium]